MLIFSKIDANNNYYIASHTNEVKYLADRYFWGKHIQVYKC